MIATQVKVDSPLTWLPRLAANCSTTEVSQASDMLHKAGSWHRMYAICCKRWVSFAFKHAGYQKAQLECRSETTHSTFWLLRCLTCTYGCAVLHCGPCNHCLGFTASVCNLMTNQCMHIRACSTRHFLCLLASQMKHVRNTFQIFRLMLGSGNYSALMET